MIVQIEWWMFPTLVTIVSTLLALFGFKCRSGMMIGNIMMLVPAWFVSGIIWVVAAVFK